jgi:hypothetical protein
LGLNVSVEIGLNKAKPLLDAAFDVPTAFAHISKDLLPYKISTGGEAEHIRI